MLRKIGLSSAVLLGLGSVVAVGMPGIRVPGMLRSANVDASGMPQSVASDGKGDNIVPRAGVAADNAQAGRDLLREALKQRTAEAQLAPLIFAPASGDAAPLAPELDTGPAPATPPAGNWRDANAKMDSADSEAAMTAVDADGKAADTQATDDKGADTKAADPKAADAKALRSARQEHVRRPHVAPRDRTASVTPTAAKPTCVQPTGFGGVLAAMNLRPKCEM